MGGASSDRCSWGLLAKSRCGLIERGLATRDWKAKASADAWSYPAGFIPAETVAKRLWAWPYLATELYMLPLSIYWEGERAILRTGFAGFLFFKPMAVKLLVESLRLDYLFCSAARMCNWGLTVRAQLGWTACLSDQASKSLPVTS